MSRTAVTTLSVLLLSSAGVVWAQPKSKEILHDAEYYVLEAQHGEKWAVEDSELDAKLAALQKKHGRPPNIIHIMWDDTPVGDVGIPHVQKSRGFETPTINRVAQEGIYFARMYTEPSCTPSRAAVITGRHAVRNGMYNVGVAYEFGGLAEEEVTLAEVLGMKGYATAFYGKSHLGDVESSYMNKQGFDEALWTPYNQIPSLWTPAIEKNYGIVPGSLRPDLFPKDPYDIDKGWRPQGFVWALEGKKGGPVREFGTPPNMEDYLNIDEECEKRSFAFMQRAIDAKKPFMFCYWPQMIPFTNYPDKETVSGGLLQEGLARLEPYLDQLMKYLDDQGVGENTLLVLMADNGPMTHNGPPGCVETLYRGGKGDFTEGGVRVPCLARWPGVIEPGQIVGDIIHETDLFTTFARLGGATEHIPTDRIVDGVDQTALLLKGDTYSRRDHVHIYTGPILAATVKGRFKRHWVGALPGLAGAEFFDLYNDPREVQPKMLPLFTTKGMFARMKVMHEVWQEHYPNKGQNRDYPFTGIENARPETREASKPRIPADRLPFNPREFIKRIPEWDNVDAKWSAGQR